MTAAPWSSPRPRGGTQPEGAGVGEGPVRMASSTPSRLSVMSLFQIRITRQPLSCNHFVLNSSAALLACWLPSTSITRRCSMQTKSAMYGPIGGWRRILQLSKRRSRSRNQRLRSACVEFFLSFRAVRFGILTRPRFARHPLPHAGEGISLLFRRRSELHRVGAVAVAERRGVDLFQFDLALRAMTFAFHESCSGILARNSGTASAGEEGRGFRRYARWVLLGRPG